MSSDKPMTVEEARAGIDMSNGDQDVAVADFEKAVRADQSRIERERMVKLADDWARCWPTHCSMFIRELRAIAQQ